METMLEWNEYHRRVLKRIADTGRILPDTVRSYRILGEAGAKTGRFDGKTRELIALALAVNPPMRGLHGGRCLMPP
jgi:alkylhydroperoxidase/carboxymuconolactone decarboxylase family protein YurZ